MSRNDLSNEDEYCITTSECDNRQDYTDLREKCDLKQIAIYIKSGQLSFSLYFLLFLTFIPHFLQFRWIFHFDIVTKQYAVISALIWGLIS